ncbi:hypothetical protein HHK36_012143 [Tetracentron sinense]|uniref:Ribosomal protein L7Ae/L30e/S12e/Gadd45 domain-containing protein n=1 Tax=Tetracentron sinense TaxID=13715 RepID=A0A834Z488_TETSI|nr:hypothetical protein HHK36_012143 [Tetracentron sinense]
MRRRNKKTRNSLEAPKSSFNSQEQQYNLYEGERLAHLLKSIEREIELAKHLKGALPDKIWIKQQFSIGVNDVTRVLERMLPGAELGSSALDPPIVCSGRNASSVQLQMNEVTEHRESEATAVSEDLESLVDPFAILVVSDCKSRWMTKHIPKMASLKKVPLIFVKDKKAGSSRLGELVKLKTALAIGVKAKGNGINKLMEKILHDSKTVDDNGLPEVS